MGWGDWFRGGGPRGLALVACSAIAMVASEPAWDYRVRVRLPGPVLDVEARLAPGDDDALHLNEGCGAFLEGLEREVKGVWSPVAWKGDIVTLPGGERAGLHLRYRFRLGEAAAALHRLMLITGKEGAYLVRPPAFLLRPRRFWPDRSARLQVETPQEWTFLSGLHPSGSGYEATAEALDDAPYSALGQLKEGAVTVQGATLQMAWPAAADFDATVLEPWIRRSGEEVAWAFGRFPVDRCVLFLWPSGRGGGVGFGTAAGMGGAGLIVLLGRDWATAPLAKDWVLTHEFTHLGLPTLDPSHRWLEEGLPTYLEPLLALRAGRITPERFWGDLVKELPQGQPGAGDRGLDRTPTWGRTYWGGALFFFLADLEMREGSVGRSTLLDALRGLRAEGLSAEQSSELEPVLAALDRGVGRDVFRRLHAQHGTQARSVDLAAIWRRLGVAVQEGRVRFDDSAPSAGLRRAWAGPFR